MIADNWLAHTLRFESEGYTPDLSAYELDRLCHVSPHSALQVIMHIIKQFDFEDLQVPSEDKAQALLSNLAAGPLEDLLVHHGPLVVSSIESAARDDRRVAWTIAHVWRNDIDQGVWTRLQRVALVD